jgi:hypothetical protein
MSPYEQVEVDAPGAAVGAALREGLRARGLTEYADLADRFTAVLRALADEARAGAGRAGGPGPAGPP